MFVCVCLYMVCMCEYMCVCQCVYMLCLYTVFVCVRARVWTRSMQEVCSSLNRLTANPVGGGVDLAARAGGQAEAAKLVRRRRGALCARRGTGGVSGARASGAATPAASRVRARELEGPSGEG